MGQHETRRLTARWTVRGAAVLWSARVAVATSCVFLISVWAAKPTPGGDTPWLLDGTDFLRGCLSRGTLVKCGYSPKPDDWSLMTLMARAVVGEVDGHAAERALEAMTSAAE